MDYVDLLWVHAWDPTVPVDEVMRGLDDVVRAGDVLYVGVSNPPAWVAARANTLAELRGWSPFAGMQVQYSLLERSIERDILPMSRELGIGVVAWSPLAGGMLTGKYRRLDAGSRDEIDQSLRRESNKGRVTERNLAIVSVVEAVAAECGRSPSQVAMRWVHQRAGVTSIILGARTLRQLEDNLQSASFELTDEQMKQLDDVSAIDLGYPHVFLKSPSVTKLIYGGTKIE